MPRQKKAEQAKPKTGEVISFASLKAAREEKRADLFFTVAVMSEEEPRAGSLTLCLLKDGGHTIGYIYEKNPDGTFQVESDREGEVVGVCGRVVSVQQIDDAGD